MSNFELNLNMANLNGFGYNLPSFNFDSNASGFSGSLFNFQFPTLQSFNFCNFNNFDSAKTEDGYSMYKGSYKKETPAFDSNNYFNTTWEFEDLKLTTPKINYTLSPFGKNSKASAVSGKTNYQITDLNTKTSLPEIKGFYNPDKGLKLAESTAANAHNRSTGYCARYVKTALSNTGLSPYYNGHAYQLADNLENNKNFKEVNVAPQDLAKLPAGCVIVYAKGAGNASKLYGHTEVTLGNGKAASDFIRNNIKQSNNVRVFVPV